MSRNNEKKSLPAIIVASSVGTLIEWYDFFIFGSLATIIATEFFPSENPNAALLATLATFAAGLIVRPLGALFFGRMGDMLGRKRTFMITLSIMGITTLGIGLTPGYATIGFWSPIIVLFLRLLQGVALGGEYGGAAVYVAEHAPEKRKGFFTSWIQSTSGLAFILSISVVLMVKSVMPETTWLQWGWRIPFIASIFLVGISIYIRSKMQESPLFKKVKAQGKLSSNPIKETFTHRKNLKLVLLVFLAFTLGGGGIGWITFYAQNFLLRTAYLDYEQANSVIIIGLLLGAPFFILFGWLSDKIGRRNILIAGMLLGVLLFRPVFGQMYQIVENERIASIATSEDIPSSTVQVGNEPDASLQANISTSTEEFTVSQSGKWKLILMVLVLQFIFTTAYSPLAAYLVELFPVNIRYTSVSFPYHFGMGIFGGLAPYFATYLVQKAQVGGDANFYLSGVHYPIALCALSVVIALLYVDDDRNYLLSKHSFPKIKNNIRKWLGLLWIILALWAAWYGLSRLGIPSLLSSKNEELVFGIILTFLIVPIAVVGLILFGIFSFKDEYATRLNNADF